ncbi:MAG: 50S ribosomal protein L6 [Candidatus Shikimatogenerans sp. Tduv]|uniref:50S ribosomal protein L6 n=1 Tax=Candidatus Shikimatogenerans sp. Tduv TaxID=3158567 RepID=A0AAU7QRD9_9FLAO
MSRIGKKKIFIPKKVIVKYINNILYVKGILGKLQLKINREIILLMKKKYIKLKIYNKKSNLLKSLYGLYRTLINNMIIGVYKGFKKTLLVIGIEYKVLLHKHNNILEFDLGYSHNIMIDIPKCINVKLNNKENNILINLYSYNNVILGLYSSIIKSFKKPDSYKGKGIRYLNEYIFKKVKKKV